MNGRMRGSQFVRDLTGAIGRVVIHHQQIHLNRQAQNAFRKRGEVLPLVIGRDDNDGLIHAPFRRLMDYNLGVQAKTSR